MISPLLMVIELWFSVQCLPVDMTVYVQQEHYTGPCLLTDAQRIYNYSLHARSCVESMDFSITDKHCRPTA